MLKNLKNNKIKTFKKRACGVVINLSIILNLNLNIDVVFGYDEYINQLMGQTESSQTQDQTQTQTQTIDVNNITISISEDVYVSTGGQYFKSRTQPYEDSVGDLLEIYEYTGGDEFETVVVPSVIDEIVPELLATNVFKGNETIKEVVLPNTIEMIGYNAFLDCTSLESVIISEDTKMIGAKAFANTSISAILIPGSIEGISYSAFNKASNLEAIVFTNSSNRDYEIWTYEDKQGINVKCKVYGYKNTIAEAYAKAINREFIALDGLSVNEVHDLTNVNVSTGLTNNFLNTSPTTSSSSQSPQINQNLPTGTVVNTQQPGNSSVEDFYDVNSNDWFADDVMYTLNNNLLTDFTDGDIVEYEDGSSSATQTNQAITDLLLFEPDLPINRGTIAQVFASISQADTSMSVHSFEDIEENPYEEAIAWCYENNIVNGNGDGTFRPYSAITREEFAQILYNYAQFANYSGGMIDYYYFNRFMDIDKISLWARDAMSWALSANLFKGSTDGYLYPKESITRAEAASVITNYGQTYVY